MMIFLLAAAVQDCSKSIVQSELNRCAYREYQAADRAMNSQWRVTLARIRANDQANGADGFGPPTESVLLKSQRAWLAYRDAQCMLEGETARGGSMQPMLVSGCMATLTLERTRALKEAIETL